MIKMQWIILIGDKNFDLNTIKKIKHNGSINSYDVNGIPNRYCVDFGDNHIFYDFDNQIKTDYDVEELKKIPYTNPNFIIMTYTSEECVRKILGQDSFPDTIYIDNDYGLILPIKEFIKLGMPLLVYSRKLT